MNMKHLARELVRPRGPTRHRFYRVDRSSRAGIALLMVISGIMLLTVLVTEITYSSTVRGQLAAQHRDEVKAEILAKTGIHLYRLILISSKAIGRNPFVQQAGEMFGINGDSLWQMIPFMNTGLLRLLFVSGEDLEEKQVTTDERSGKANDMGRSMRGQKSGSRGGRSGSGGGRSDVSSPSVNMSREDRDASRESSSAFKRNFLDFDGDFSAKVVDENQFIHVAQLNAPTMADLLLNPTAVQLQGLMAGEQHNEFFYDNNLEPLELVANLVDWTDLDDTRLFEGGDEAALYERLEHPYKPKNGPFDTLEEVRLVDGWHLDEVWDQFGQYITIFGQGQVNVNTAPRPVLRAILMAYMDGVTSELYVRDVLTELIRYRSTPVALGGVYFSSPQHFAMFLQNTLLVSLRPEITQAISTQSNVFRVSSVGEVGNARVEVVAVFDYTSSPVGQVLYWKVE